jgi:hypothetical protein
VAVGIASEVAKTAQAINGIVAPAIMISASALIILALQGKYSQLIDRLRALNEERRHLVHPSEEPVPVLRLANVVAQIEVILLRARLVRNSIVSLYLAIALFVLSSMLIGAPVVFGFRATVNPSIAVFMLAMVLVFLGVIYALRDIARAFTVAKLEVRGVKGLHKDS